MLKYHLRSFFRNLKRNRLFSIINILGLSFGICSALLIYLYVNHELSYDRFHTKADKIFRVNQPFIWGENNENQFSSTGPGVAYAINNDIPEVEQVTRLHTIGSFLVQYEKRNGEVIAFDEENILSADSNFLDVFTFPLLEGNKNEALKAANSIILTQETAKRYFGEEEAIGKTLLFSQNGKRTSYVVTGIAEDTPNNSYIEFDMLLSMASFPKVAERDWSWIWTTFITFVELKDGADAKIVEDKLAALPPKYAGKSLEILRGISFEEYHAQGKSWDLYLQPFTDIRLGSSNVINRINTVGEPTIIYALFGSAIFIILLSCINFMNLSTAQFTKRAKTTGIHKVLGSGRKQLAFKYITESIAFSLIGLVIALMITQLSLAPFNQLVGKELSFQSVLTLETGIALFAFTLAIGIFSGAYPALFLSGFSPIETLKGKLKTGKQGKAFRNGLVVIQFVLSMILVISTLVVYKQLSYTNERNIGFDKDNLLVIDGLNHVSNPNVLADKVRRLNGVKSVTVSYGIPTRIWNSDGFKAMNATDKTATLNYAMADEYYLPTLGAPLLFGRNFTETSSEERNNVILNETAVKQFGWQVEESILEQQIQYEDNKNYTIIGIVKDYHFGSSQSLVEALGIFHNSASELNFNSPLTSTLKIETKSSKELQLLISNLKAEWKALVPSIPFKYFFIDEALDRGMASEARLGKALTIFAGLALLIACLGLLGMVIFNLEYKTKEIGIRKVLGSSVFRVLLLLYKDYIKLIAVASIISIPFSIYLMQSWLQDFQYRVPLSADIFITSIIATSAFALLITGYHSIKAALTNPVNVLRNE